MMPCTSAGSGGSRSWAARSAAARCWLTFGKIYGRAGLNLAQRQIAMLAMFTALPDCARQLRFHVEAALRAGLSRDQVIEVIIACAPTSGFPGRSAPWRSPRPRWR